MTMIEADSATLLQQATMTARDYMSKAVDDIDQMFGKGYAAKNPQLVGSYMQTAALDLGAACIAKVIGEAIEDISGRDIAAGLESVASSIYKLGLGNASTSMGALEAHGVHMGEVVGGISSALDRLADAVEAYTVSK